MRQLTVFCFVWLSLSGCKKPVEPVMYKYQLEAEIRIPTNLQLAAQQALPAVTTYNPTDSVLSDQGYTGNQINEILVDSIYITTNDTVDTDLGFLQELDLLLEGGNAAKMLIGTTGDLPETLADTIGLTSTTRNLKEFLLEDSVLIWPELIIDQTVLSPTTVQVIMDLSVEIEE